MENLDERLDGAIARNDFAAVVELLEKGASISYVDGLGWNPLMNAAWVGASDIVELLLSRGADPAWKNREGKNVLELLQELGELDAPHRRAYELIESKLDLDK